MSTYLFYDLETTGLNRAFDQVLQFAAIKTDMSFNEIDRHEIRIRLRPDVIISPHAIITHRIPIHDAASGIPEFEATQQIHALLNEPGTISLGYNSLGFDDEFLRFSFHRNLLPPYTHQYSNGCRRMDILPITVIYKLYNRDILTWPDNNGKPSLKLEDLSAANNLASGRSHDAMTDVEATRELARKLQNSHKMWDYLAESFIKNVDQKRVNQLPVSFQTGEGIHRLGLMTGSEFGAKLGYQVPVLSIGNSIPYANQSLWLRTDLPELKTAESENISDTTWVIRKKYGEPGIILPPLERYWKCIDKERRQCAEENLEWLKSNPDMLQRIISYHREFRYPFIPDIDADAALYQAGFLPREAEVLCRKFHLSSNGEKAELIASFPTHETRILAGRVIARNYPEYASNNIQTKFSHYMKCINPENPDDAIIDYRGEKRRTPSSALADIDQLKKSSELGPKLDNEQIELIKDLEQYIIKKFRK
ncbi:MAG: exodeoxyribonuclease I [Deltaproteobacteria bacterium]|nr:exodeoxyribonuclease I [Deltaproteobacteria bacterium]MBW2218659.1 exodeoxyribonuclease I [Deltaproteobacteria bacterium]